MPVPEEGAFPVRTNSVQLFLKRNLKQLPDAQKSRNSGLERLLHGVSLGAAALETARGLEGYGEGSVSQKGCREKEEEMGENSLPASLPSLRRGLAVPTQTFQLANQTQLPRCCHGLKTSTSPRGARPARSWGAAFLSSPSCPSAPLASLPLHTSHMEVRFSPSYLFAFSKVSTFFQSSLFSVVYVSTLWE